MKPAPPDWGSDPFTSYLDRFRQNQYATFHNKKAEVADIISIDAIFIKLMHGARDLHPFVPLQFLLRAHSAYRAAAGAVFAGQLYEAQAVLRLCLEHASYACYIGDDTERWKRWINRNDSAATKEVVRKEFTGNKIKKHIQAQSPLLGLKFETLYERLIDFGAHPNEQGFSSNSAIRRVGNDVHFDTVFLQGSGLQLDLALKTTAQVGLWVAHIAQLTYPGSFQLLGLSAELERLRTRY